MTIARREFLRLAAAGAALGVMPALSGRTYAGAAAPKVVVIGAGFGGATAAKYLRKWGGNIEVTVIDRLDKFVSCPLSNLVFAGKKKLEDITRTYDGLKKHGANVVIDEVTGIDADKRVVKTAKGSYSYDRLIISPGVELLFDQIKGYDAKTQETVTHAWKAGPQTLKLRSQMEAMPDGGVIVVGMPLAPYRCPPGPYERVCMMASYLKTKKPKSKVIMLDANPDIASKKPLFEKVFKSYGSLVEYRPNAKVLKVDAAKMTVSTEFDDVKADVINLIPPQRAGELTEMAGVRTDSNKTWCPVSFVTYESKSVKNIHVIGDSVLANYPKSGHMANNMGKIAAAAVIELLNGRQPDPVPVVANTCYSVVGFDPDLAIHVATVFRYDAAKDQMTAQPGGGISKEPSEVEAGYAESWAENIWSDVFG